MYRVVSKSVNCAAKLRSLAGNHSFRRNISVSSAVERQSWVVAVVRDPDLAIFAVDRQAHRAVDASTISVNDAHGSHVSAPLAIEDQNGIVAVIRYDDRVVDRIFGDPHRPIEFCRISLNGTQWRLIVPGV